MKIKVLKPVYLDFEDEAGETKKYTPSPDAEVFEIDDKLAEERNYLERYKKYPEHIEIIEEYTAEELVEPSPEVVSEPEPDKTPKKSTRTKSKKETEEAK